MFFPDCIISLHWWDQHRAEEAQLLNISGPGPSGPTLPLALTLKRPTLTNLVFIKFMLVFINKSLCHTSISRTFSWVLISLQFARRQLFVVYSACTLRCGRGNGWGVHPPRAKVTWPAESSSQQTEPSPMWEGSSTVGTIDGFFGSGLYSLLISGNHRPHRIFNNDFYFTLKEGI